MLCVLQGVMRARGSHILFADADAATEITDLDKLCAAACCQTTYGLPLLARSDLYTNVRL